MTPAPHDDASLPRAFLEGEVEAHHEVRRWVEPVVRCGSWRFADPDGVVQEVLLKLVTILRAGRFRADASFKTFVVSIARHSCIDVYRRERFRGTFESDVAPEDVPQPAGPAARDPEGALRARERLERLMFIFQNLPDECRKLWRLVYGESLAPAEVAVRLGISGVTARVRVHRCLEKARKIGQQFAAAPVS